MRSQKLITLALVVVLVLSLAACSSSAPAAAEPAAQPAAAEPTAAPTEAPAAEPAPAASGLKDGSYTAAQDKYDDYGWKGQITIEVKEGKISSVDFDYVNKDNKLKSEDQGYIKAMEDKTKVNLAKAMEELESSFLSSQDAAAVNAVSGATTTSDDFKGLAENALKGAK
ncbi:MAG TPA: FMN-binding protein [Clostridia bacterium]|nr:FMN-binding protein [Clostridia bacterium]